MMRKVNLWGLHLGLVLCAVGFNFFATPNHFVFGGATGASIVMASRIPGLSASQCMWIINLILIGLGCLFLGKQVMGWTLYYSFSLTLICSLLEHFWPISVPMTEDPLLELVFSVMLLSASSGIVFCSGATTGGTEILALILQKYLGLDFGKALLVSDVTIVVAAAEIYGPSVGLYCILGLLVKGIVVDNAIGSIHLCKVCTVISRKPEAVRDYILHTLNRAATEQPVRGAYTHEEKTAILVVLNRRQTVQLRNFLRTTDPEAFLTVVNSSEIGGNGFQPI
jgi:uncharacterized membrane-anchored protein YitT (DUF2179 family)